MIIVCGCAIGLLSFGPRSSLGFFVQPMSREFSWGRDVFGLALAVQNLLWGLGQPVAGAIADRFGVMRVMCVGALLYAGGLLMMRYAATPLSLDHRRRRADRLRAVRLFVQSGAVGVQQAVAAGAAGHCAWRRNRRRIVRAIPVRAVRRGDDRQFRLAAGADGIRRSDAADRPAVARARDAAGDIGQRAGRRTSSRSRRRWRKRSAIAPMCCWCSASSPAAFSSLSSPCICRPIWSIAAYSAQTGGWVIAAIGLFNIIGSLSVGWLQNRFPKRYILSAIYFAARAVDRGFHLVSDHHASPRSCSAPSPA